MNRIIKFRIWDKEQKLFIENLFIDQMGKIWYPISDENGKYSCFEYNPDKKLILLQFTGLLDIKEKEIYEGDIIEYKIHYYSGDTKTYTDQVLYSVDDMPRWTLGKTLSLSSDFCPKIIGNIWENPDILEN